ncbi:YciI family protein [Chitinophaga polysaccharea]|uniref:YciI family protein n=1 Tax=Chitinophaga TaxID=79328 RepID=UPI00145534BD|nr:MULTISPECIES: YciI family protein [Chitinophaga]NLR62498.1 YciI family protein [Chitinophaga polysaccharea]NLU92332.1 YciI family protein [Chitinophaga sp. Ak27]
MKYICLGYMNEEVWETLSESERQTFMDECFGYDAELRQNGHYAGGEGLQEARNAATLRWRSGKVSVTDGPFAESKEQIGGIMILEATDLNHAIRLLSKHPSLRLGRGGNSWEIRPAFDLTDFIEDSKRRGE